jgi:hypothetical protein
MELEQPTSYQQQQQLSPLFCQRTAVVVDDDVSGGRNSFGTVIYMSDHRALFVDIDLVAYLKEEPTLELAIVKTTLR